MDDNGQHFGEEDGSREWWEWLVQMATRECLCLVPTLIDSNSAMLEARPHPSYQRASGFARNARLAQPSEWATGSVRIRHSACSHQPSSFVPSPTLLAFILGRMHTNAILSVAVRHRPRRKARCNGGCRASAWAAYRTLSHYLGPNTNTPRTPDRRGTRIAERLC